MLPFINKKAPESINPEAYDLSIITLFYKGSLDQIVGAILHTRKLSTSVRHLL